MINLIFSFFLILFLNQLDLKAEAISSNSRIIDSIVAIVNNDIISKSDLKKYETDLKKGRLGEEIWLYTKEDLLKNPQKMLKAMIYDKLIEQLIADDDIKIEDTELEKHINYIQKLNNLSRHQLIEALSAEGIDFTAYREKVKDGLKKRKYLEKVVYSKIDVSESEVKEYYMKNFEADNSKIRVRIRILSLPQDKTTETEINTLHDKLEKNPNLFDDAVKANTGVDSIETDLGFLNYNELNPNFQTALSKLSPGDISSVFKMQGNFYILKLIDKKVGEDDNYQKNKDKIIGMIKEEKSKQLLEEWLSKEEDKAFIKINEK